MAQVARALTMADTGTCRVLICDRDAKWSEAIRTRLQDAGLRVIRTPYRARAAVRERACRPHSSVPTSRRPPQLLHASGVTLGVQIRRTHGTLRGDRRGARA